MRAYIRQLQLNLHIHHQMVNVQPSHLNTAYRDAIGNLFNTALFVYKYLSFAWILTMDVSSYFDHY